MKLKCIKCIKREMPVCEFTRKDGSRVRFMTHPHSKKKKSGKNNCDEEPKKKAPRSRSRRREAPAPTRRQPARAARGMPTGGSRPRVQELY